MTKEQVRAKYGEPFFFKDLGLKRSYNLYHIGDRTYAFAMPATADEQFGEIEFLDAEPRYGFRPIQVTLSMTKEQYDKAPFFIARQVISGYESTNSTYNGADIGKSRLCIISEDGSIYEIGDKDEVVDVFEGRYIALAPRRKSGEKNPHHNADRIVDLKTNMTVIDASQIGFVEYWEKEKNFDIVYRQKKIEPSVIGREKKPDEEVIESVSIEEIEVALNKKLNKDAEKNQE